MRTERPCPPIGADGQAGPNLAVDDWKSWTLQQYLDECSLAARAFIGLGLGPKDAVAIYGFNAPEWIMGEMAAILAGGIAAGIYPTDTPSQVCYKAQHSGSVIACVESIAKAEAFLVNAATLPKLKAVVVWDPDTTEDQIKALASTAAVKVHHWRELGSLAEVTPASDLDTAMSNQKPSECCAYIYTSGTTGAPKAVMISHDNIVFESRSALESIQVFGRQPEEERLISYLPLSHVAGMMVDIVCPLVAAAELPGWACCFFARNYDLRVGSIVERFKAVRPTIFLGVPRVWEKIQAKIIAKKNAAIAAGEMSATVVRISDWGKALSLEHANERQMGGSGKKPMMYGTVAEGLVQKKAKGALGLDHCKFAFTGAAPIAVETLRYFASIGININEVYGMSECTGAATWSNDKAHVWGSVGWAIPGMEVKVFKEDTTGSGSNSEVPPAQNMFAPTEAEQGELCYRGRNVMMGYLANPDLGAEHVAEIERKTKETVDMQGWLHSGDKGCADSRGMFRVTGRYKELLIGAGGENIAPVPIEDNIKALCPAISNVMMVGDKMPFNCLLVTLKAEGANGEQPGGDDLDGEALAFQKSLPSAAIATPRDLATTISACVAQGSENFLVAAVASAIEQTNKNETVCPFNAAKVQKFCILPCDFAVQTDDFTPTFKLKRQFVAEKYAKAIANLYKSKDVFVPFNNE